MLAHIRALLAISLLLTIPVVHAQNTVGELLDAGGAKLTKAQQIAELSGTNVSGLTASGKAEMNVDFKADGTFSGLLTSKGPGGTSPTIGKWSVDDNGKMCTDERMAAWNIHHKACFYSYRLGEASYRTTSDSEDRGTKILKSVAVVKKSN